VKHRSPVGEKSPFRLIDLLVGEIAARRTLIPHIKSVRALGSLRSDLHGTANRPLFLRSSADRILSCDCDYY
jgi:hypothetical protein